MANIDAERAWMKRMAEEAEARRPVPEPDTRHPSEYGASWVPYGLVVETHGDRYECTTCRGTGPSPERADHAPGCDVRAH